MSLLLAGDALHGWRVNFARVAADAEYYPQGMWLYPLAMLGWTRYGLALFGFFFPAAAAGGSVLSAAAHLDSSAVSGVGELGSARVWRVHSDGPCPGARRRVARCGVAH